MRIIGGEARGRRLFAPEGEQTRPTADRTRESLFNILSFRVSGARVLDLFGGSGALALEAVSRGARSAVIVEKSSAAMRVIRRNAVWATGERVTLLQADYRKAIDDMTGEPFDLVFLDPPYRMTDAYADAALRLIRRGLIAEDALILMEHAAGDALLLPDEFALHDRRVYRETVIDFVKRRNEA